MAVGTLGQGARLTGVVCLLAAAGWLIAGNTSQSRTAGCGITAWTLGVCCLWLARRARTTVCVSLPGREFVSIVLLALCPWHIH